MRLSVLGRRRGRAWAWLMVGLLIGAAAGAGAVYVLKRGKAGLPGGPRLGNAAELAMVPADSAGFIHVRARDIWKLEHLDFFRRAADKAGPDALKALDEGFVPAPSTLDRMTVVFLKGDEAKQPLAPPRGRGNVLPPGLGLPPVDLPSEVGGVVVILAFSSPFDAGKVRDTYMPQGNKKAVNGKDVWLDLSADLGLYFPGDTVMVLGPAAGVERFANKMAQDGKPTEGPLAASLKVAAEGGRHVLAGINLKSFGLQDPKLFDRATGEIKAIENDMRALLKAESLAVGVAFVEGGTKLDVRASYASDDDARSAEASARAVAAHLRKKLDEPKKQLQAMLDGKPGQGKPRPIRELPEAVLGLFGTGALNILDGHLENPPIKTEGKELVATLDTDTIGGAYVGAAAVGRRPPVAGGGEGSRGRRPGAGE